MHIYNFVNHCGVRRPLTTTIEDVNYLLKFMEAHCDIPPEYYGRWWKVINDEFGEIINDDETSQAGNGETEVDKQDESHTLYTSPQPSAVEAEKTKQLTHAPLTEQQRHPDVPTTQEQPSRLPHLWFVTELSS